jgi:hypothetical protein
MSHTPHVLTALYCLCSTYTAQEHSDTKRLKMSLLKAYSEGMNFEGSVCGLRTTEIIITRPTRFSAFQASKTSSAIRRKASESYFGRFGLVHDCAVYVDIYELLHRTSYGRVCIRTNATFVCCVLMTTVGVQCVVEVC